MKRIRRGFTLIELLVVIAIIALLSSVVLSSLNTARAKARDAERLSDLHQLEIALAAYYADNGSYPVSGWSGACSGYGGHGTSGPTGWIPDLAPKYIPVLPVDPKPLDTIRCYVYRSTGTDYIVLVNSTVETYSPSNNPRPRPAVPAQPSFAAYTSGAATW